MMTKPVEVILSSPGEETSISVYKINKDVIAIETSRGNAVYMYPKEAAAFCEWFKREFPDG
jgi:hypothetical protein